VRLRTAAAKRFKKVLMVAETTFRCFDHAELLPQVAEGVQYKDGVRIVATKEPKESSKKRRAA